MLDFSTHELHEYTMGVGVAAILLLMLLRDKKVAMGDVHKFGIINVQSLYRALKWIGFARKSELFLVFTSSAIAKGSPKETMDI